MVLPDVQEKTGFPSVPMAMDVYVPFGLFTSPVSTVLRVLPHEQAGFPQCYGLQAKGGPLGPPPKIPANWPWAEPSIVRTDL